MVVRPGGRVPADGEIVDGSAHVDESMITGESRPVRRGVGDPVVAGTVATDSGLRVEVTAVGDDTALAGIQRLVTEAQNSSSRAQRIADRAAAWLFWFALGAGIITAVVWGLLGQPDEAVVRTITVLVIACPHALGLAIPLVVSIATERAARGGVLIKDRLALESMRTVDAVLFDKTGTLTKGEPAVTAIADGQPRRGEPRETRCWRWPPPPNPTPSTRWPAPSSRRPAAAACRSAALGLQLVTRGRGDGHGGRATGAGRRPGLLEEAGRAELPDVRPWRDEGAIVLHVLVDGAVVGALKLADEIRPESRQAVDALHARHRGGDDHRRRRGGGRVGGRRPGHRPGIRRGPARGQGRQGRRAAAGGAQGRDGRRRRQRRPGAGRRPTWASRSARAPTSPSPRPA